MIKKLIWLLSLIAILTFSGCGSGSSKEAKELLQKILNLVGIPQSIVVNVCQDNNENGICEISEPQIELQVDKEDTVDKLLKKILLIDNGKYLLETYDETKPILLTLRDPEHVKDNGGEFTIHFNGFKTKEQNETKELSPIQAIVDAGYLDESQTKALKELDNRELIDSVIFRSLENNYNLLKDENLSEYIAVDKSLEALALGLQELNVSKELPNRVASCENNNSCIENLLTNTSKELNITQEEAEVIADEVKKESQPIHKKNIADGYIIKLFSPIKAICKDKTYSTSTDIGEKGSIIFNNASLDNSCEIVVPSNSIIDSNNNGKYDERDKPLGFVMKARADTPFITPLTTLLLSKEQKGEDISSFKKLVKNFNPITSASAVGLYVGEKKNQTQKLMVLNEILKTALKEKANISSINLSQIVDSSISIKDMSINSLIRGLSSNIQSKIKSDLERSNFKELVTLIDRFDNSKINLNTFMVNVSDGDEKVDSAIKIASKVPIGEDVNPIDVVVEPDVNVEDDFGEVDVTKNPESSPTVEPSPTPEPSPTVEPSPTPEPSPTVEPSATPQPSPTVEPSATPQPSPTVEPSSTPEPSPTVEPSATPQPTPTPTNSGGGSSGGSSGSSEKTEKNIADGYLLKLSTPAKATCGSNQYSSSMSVGAKGKVTFEGVSLSADCIINVSSGATIDANNNGKLDSNDTIMPFDMSGPADASYITPLTTLLLEKKANGEDISEYKNMVKDFDPVIGAEAIKKSSGIEKVKMGKLMILMETIKSSLGEAVDIKDINISSVIKTEANETIDDFDVHKLTANLPSDIEYYVSEKADIMKETISVLNELNSSKINLNNFIVNISDGFGDIESSAFFSMGNDFMNSFFGSDPYGNSYSDPYSDGYSDPYSGGSNGSDVFSFIVNSNADVSNVKNRLISINNRIKSLNTPSIDLENERNVTEGTKVTINANISIAPYRFRYEWKEGDNILGSKSILNIDNIEVGVHNITLIVRNRGGNTIATRTITINAISHSKLFFDNNINKRALDEIEVNSEQISIHINYMPKVNISSGATFGLEFTNGGIKDIDKIALCSEGLMVGEMSDKNLSNGIIDSAIFTFNSTVNADATISFHQTDCSGATPIFIANGNIGDIFSATVDSQNDNYDTNSINFGKIVGKAGTLFFSNENELKSIYNVYSLADITPYYNVNDGYYYESIHDKNYNPLFEKNIDSGEERDYKIVTNLVSKFEIVDGLDSKFFDISRGNRKIAYIDLKEGVESPTANNPQDYNHDGIYEVKIKATDVQTFKSGTIVLKFKVVRNSESVGNQYYSAPQLVSTKRGYITKYAKAGGVVLSRKNDYYYWDDEKIDNIISIDSSLNISSIELVGDGANDFKIVDNKKVILDGSLDYSSKPEYDLMVVAKDSSGNEYNSSLIIEVTNDSDRSMDFENREILEKLSIRGKLNRGYNYVDYFDLQNNNPAKFKIEKELDYKFFTTWETKYHNENYSYISYGFYLETNSTFNPSYKTKEDIDGDGIYEVKVTATDIQTLESATITLKYKLVSSNIMFDYYDYKYRVNRDSFQVNSETVIGGEVPYTLFYIEKANDVNITDIHLEGDSDFNITDGAIVVANSLSSNSSHNLKLVWRDSTGYSGEQNISIAVDDNAYSHSSQFEATNRSKLKQYVTYWWDFHGNEINTNNIARLRFKGDDALNYVNIDEFNGYYNRHNTYFWFYEKSHNERPTYKNPKDSNGDSIYNVTAELIDIQTLDKIDLDYEFHLLSHQVIPYYYYHNEDYRYNNSLDINLTIPADAPVGGELLDRSGAKGFYPEFGDDINYGNAYLEGTDASKFNIDHNTITLKESLPQGLYEFTLVVKDSEGVESRNPVYVNVGNVEPPEPKSDISLGNTLLFGNKYVSISKADPFTLNLSKDNNISEFYNISLTNAVANNPFSEKSLGLIVQVTNRDDSNDFVKLTINNMYVSNNNSEGLKSRIKSDTEVRVDETINGETRSYTANLSSGFDKRYDGLTIEIQDIIDDVNSPQITNGLNRMNGYLHTAGKRYSVSMSFTGLDSSGITMDFTDISGYINVNN